jgi:hypothetical protein
MAAQGGDKIYAERTGIPGTLTVNDIRSGGMGVVAHGSDASTPRPTGYNQITWMGSVDPTNKITNDIWFQTT